MRPFLLFSLSTALLLSQLAYAPPHPTWWATRGVLDASSNPDDHAAVNQGQLKNLARATFDEMQATLPGGAGTALMALIDSWETPTASTDDFLPVNQGQLKALAAPFYQRLEAVRASLVPDWPVIHFPWAQPGPPAAGAADPQALANIGQVKNLFAQLDGNRHQHGDLSDPSANPADYQFGNAWLKDSTGSGTPDYQAIELDTSLLVYEFALVSGGGQTVAPNAVSADPIIVKLLHQNAPAANVAVTLSTGGSAATTGALGSSASGPWETELTLSTNTQGEVQVWWQAPGEPNQPVTVTATAPGQTAPLGIPVGTETGGGPSGPGNGIQAPDRNTQEMVDTIVLEASNVSFYAATTIDYLDEAWWKEYNITEPPNWVFDFGAGTSPTLPFLEPQPATVNAWPTFERRSFPPEGQSPSFVDVLRVNLFATSDHYGYNPEPTFIGGADWTCQWMRFRIKSAVPLPEGLRLKYVGFEHRSAQIESSSATPQFDPGQPSEMSIHLELVIPPGGTTSNVITLTPRTTLNAETYLGEILSQTLLPIELAPEVLAANTNFDEGDIDPETGFAIPDCENDSLKAVRNHLDGKWSANQIVTSDLHYGFFDLRPGVLPYGQTSGATVTIRKLSAIDPDTGHEESGHVCLWAVRGSPDNESEMRIDLYNPETLQGYDLGPILYEQDPGEPVTYYIEGTQPGKITLEFSYQNGDLNLNFDQQFTVYTRKSKTDWQDEIAYQIRLQSGVDVKTLNPNNPYPAQKPVIEAIYNYYGQMYLQSDDVLQWSGLGKLAGAAVYSGLNQSLIDSSGTSVGLRHALMSGAKAVYEDIAWQHRCYQASKIWGIKWVADNDSTFSHGQPQVRLVNWIDCYNGEKTGNQTFIDMYAGEIARREQQSVLSDAFEAIATLGTNPPGPGWVARSMSDNAKSPIPPGVPTFLSVFPAEVGGIEVHPINAYITNFDHRWHWVALATQSMLGVWSGLGAQSRETHVLTSLDDLAELHNTY